MGASLSDTAAHRPHGSRGPRPLRAVGSACTPSPDPSRAAPRGALRGRGRVHGWAPGRARAALGVAGRPSGNRSDRAAHRLGLRGGLRRLAGRGPRPGRPAGRPRRDRRAGHGAHLPERRPPAAWQGRDTSARHRDLASRRPPSLCGRALRVLRHLVPAAGSRRAAVRDGAGRRRGARGAPPGGGWTMVQDESSSVVFGMPKVALEIGAATISLPPRELGLLLSRCWQGDRP